MNGSLLEIELGPVSHEMLIEMLSHLREFTLLTIGFIETECYLFVACLHDFFAHE